MNEVSVFWIILPLFIAVGMYLLWYSHRRKKMLEAFAAKHQLQIRPEQEKELQETLDLCFSLQGDGLVRSFGQISSLVDGGSVRLFRTVELLDLNPHAQAYSTHFTRIAALFEISGDYDEFFLLDRSMQASQRLHSSKLPDPHVVEIIRQLVSNCHARHSLTVTFARGYGLIYFEPLVTGGETADDMDSLYCIARNISEKLST